MRKITDFSINSSTKNNIKSPATGNDSDNKNNNNRKDKTIDTSSTFESLKADPTHTTQSIDLASRLHKNVLLFSQYISDPVRVRISALYLYLILQSIHTLFFPTNKFTTEIPLVAEIQKLRRDNYVEKQLQRVKKALLESQKLNVKSTEVKTGLGNVAKNDSKIAKENSNNDNNDGNKDDAIKGHSDDNNINSWHKFQIDITQKGIFEYTNEEILRIRDMRGWVIFTKYQYLRNKEHLKSWNKNVNDDAKNKVKQNITGFPKYPKSPRQIQTTSRSLQPPQLSKLSTQNASNTSNTPSTSNTSNTFGTFTTANTNNVANATTTTTTTKAPDVLSTFKPLTQSTQYGDTFPIIPPSIYYSPHYHLFFESISPYSIDDFLLYYQYYSSLAKYSIPVSFSIQTVLPCLYNYLYQSSKYHNGIFVDDALDHLSMEPNFNIPPRQFQSPGQLQQLQGKHQRSCLDLQNERVKENEVDNKSQEHINNPLNSTNLSYSALSNHLSQSLQSPYSLQSENLLDSSNSLHSLHLQPFHSPDSLYYIDHPYSPNSNESSYGNPNALASSLPTSVSMTHTSPCPHPPPYSHPHSPSYAFVADSNLTSHLPSTSKSKLKTQSQSQS